MKLNMKRVGICFLFCLIFIVMSMQQVYAEDIDLWIANGSIAQKGEQVGLEKSSAETSLFNESCLVIEGADFSIDTLSRDVTNYYLNWFRSIEE